MDEWLFLVMLGVLGLAFGSFANVVIWRFPRKESLSSPPSHCPRCDTPITARDNIPVLSWLILKGRCRSCTEPISPRYPAVEMLSGVLWVLAGMQWGLTPACAAAAFMFYMLLILAFIDLDTMRLPNPLVGLLAAVGLAGAVAAQFTAIDAVPLTQSGGWLQSPLPAALAGAVLGAGISLGIAALYKLIRGADGFGMGDVKLLGAMGFYLGPFVLLALFVGALLGAVAGIVAAKREGRSLAAKVPFGPFLAVGGVTAALVGPAVWGWYWALATGVGA